MAKVKGVPMSHRRKSAVLTAIVASAFCITFVLLSFAPRAQADPIVGVVLVRTPTARIFLFLTAAILYGAAFAATREENRRQRQHQSFHRHLAETMSRLLKE